MMELFNLIFVNPLINSLVLIYKIIEFINIPYPLGFSIIILTVIIRFILWPFTASQLKMSKKMHELSPEMKRLKEKHKGDSKKLQEETMLLYKKHGLNPLGGCLPTLVQFLLFPALYQVFQTFVSPDKSEIIKKFNDVLYFDGLRLNSLSDPSFFGLQLGVSPSSIYSQTPLILLVPAVTAVLQFAQSKMMFPPKVEDKNNHGSKKEEPDFQSMLQTQMIYLIPVTIGFAAFNFPIGLALYWNTFTIFAMIQQYKTSGLGGLKPLVDKYLKK